MIQLVEWKDALKHNYYFIECVFNKHGLYPNPMGEPEYPYKIDEIPELWAVVEPKRNEIGDSFWGVMDFILSNETNQDLYLEKFSEQLKSLANKFDAENFIITMDLPCSWIGQKNDFDKIQSAYAFLKSIGVDNEFYGGFIVPKKELSQILPHLFWIVRCTGMMPSVRFVIDNIPIVFMLCKYFNLHAIFYNEKLYNEQIDDIMSDTGLILCRTERCVPPNFHGDTSGKIEGRKSTIYIEGVGEITGESLGFLDPKDF